MYIYINAICIFFPDIISILELKLNFCNGAKASIINLWMIKQKRLEENGRV